MGTWQIIFLALTLVPWAWASGEYDFLDRHIQEALQKGRVAGIAAAVVEHGKIQFIKAYGVCKKGSQEAVNLDTVFELGSLSKPMTASLAAILQKKKLLDLRTPKIRQMLSHTTGYKRIGWNQKIEAGRARSQLLQELTETERAKAGTEFDYHNLAFSQIEDVIENATRMSFKRSLQQYLFAPLKMRRTTVGFEDFKDQKNKAWPHEKVKNTYKPRTRYSQNYHHTVMSAAGINSSIQDMAEFLKLLQGAYPTIATGLDLDFLWEPVTVAPDATRWFRHIPYHDLKSYYGYGWRLIDIDGERIVYHGGWVGGFINFLAFSPKKQRGIVILCNTEANVGFRTAMSFLLNG